MSNMLEQVQTDIVHALKHNEPEKVASLRLLLAALKNEQIALGRGLTEHEEIGLTQRLVKQRKEAADQYEQAKRTEQATHEQGEIALYQKYLPTQLSDEKLKDIIINAIKESRAQSMNDFGKVMKLVVSQAKGQADGKRIAQLVRGCIAHGT